VLEITDAANQAIKEIIGPDAPAGTGFRISVEGEDEDEAEVALNVEDAPVEGDVIIDAGNGVFIYLDEDAAELLEDSVLDAEPHGDHVHFELGPQNPE
jgi:Fe-S cluster assembly iron-binding protein IscA